MTGRKTDEELADLAGKTVKGQVYRWADSQAGDLSAPVYALTDADGYVTGPLLIVQVPVFGGYTAYVVQADAGNYDVDPDTIEEIADDDAAGDAGEGG